MISFRQTIMFWAIAVSLLLVLIALWLPKIPYKQVFFRHLHVFDITQSMNVEDTLFKGNKTRRLEMAKQVSKLALKNMPCGSELGYSIFTEHRSFMLLAPVEVCEHYSELMQILDSIDWQIAWRSRSEIAKGLNSANKTAIELAPPARVVFFTDGHESPPLHPELRFKPDRVSAQYQGLIVGIGGDTPSAIPRYDLAGKKLGYWRPEDVAQVDVYSRGRPVSQGESMMGAAVLLGTGKEHLSALHEAYLRGLAEESGMSYHRLMSAKKTADYLTQKHWGEARIAPGDLRWLLGLIAFLLILMVYSHGLIRYRLKKAF